TRKFFPLLAAIVALALNTQLSCPMAAIAKKSGGSTAAPATKTDLTVKIVNITSPVKAGSDATVAVETAADANCKITVKLKSGPATAAGLKGQKADSTGKASWTWKVASNTAVGDWPVEVTASMKGSKSASATGSLKVTK
ncbi:MAG: hypothetical protein ACRD3W_06855, partial [Terriglobales bacterium]